MRLLILAACLLLAACVDPGATPVLSRPMPITADDHAHVRAAITGRFHDPRAAQLRDLRAFDLGDGQGRVICGEVNGTDALGRYGGYWSFYLRVKGGRLVSRHGGAAEGNLRAHAACRDAASGQMTIGPDSG